MIEDTTEPPTFTFGQVDNILADLFTIAPAKRATFTARLQQLQRIGLPRGTNVGRAAKVRYAYWQLAELVLYLDLLNCGVPPSLIKTHFGDAPAYALAGFGEIVEGSKDRGGLFYFPHLNALAHLQADNSAVTAHFGDGEFSSRSAQLVAEAVTAEPSIVINLSERLAKLRAAVARQTPVFAGLPAFPATAPRPGKIA